MWLKQCWQVVAFAGEITGAPFSRTVQDQPVVLYRTAGGTAVALADACAHRRLPLSFGTVAGDQIQCGYHGMRFRPDGTCSGVPGQTSVPKNAVVRAFPVVERGGLIWMWLGDRDRAAIDTIPDMPWLTSSQWSVVRGYHRIATAPMRIVDNLLDLSHETLVHGETIGNEAVADSPVTAELLDDDRVRVHRYMRNVQPPPLYAEQRAEPVLIDRWHTTTYTPPGVVVIESGSRPSGDRDAADVQERRILNFITPESSTVSHYFWCIARNYRIDDEAASAKLLANVEFTFDQDQRILEAQQRALGDESDPSWNVSIKVDAGPILGGRLLRSLAEREDNGSFVPREVELVSDD
jgi:phenylpropionate dioxygenase-like ring-hydroxylating dioxygenase large terminal subunit